MDKIETELVGIALRRERFSLCRNRWNNAQMLDTKTMVDAAFPGGPIIHSVADYDLRREIGRGGMSVVYEARDRRTGQEIALKLLSLPPTLTAADADGLVARFEREARTMARLSHPNIVAIHEVGASQEQHFLAMEYLQGQTLRQRLGRSRLTFQEAFALLAQIAGALDGVHAAGIVHRDIKPSNVMLLPDGTAKLLDFGIARSNEEATITNANAVIGTPSYMAPEQVRGEPAAFATDLWSLGVLGYEMFAGHQPFAGQIVANVLYQVMNKPPAPAPHLPKSMQKVLRRALDKDPARRYGSAGDFVQAMRSALPKSALPKSALPKSAPLEPELVPSKPKQPRVELPALKLPTLSVPAVPRWAQGAALLLLFGSGFGYAFQHRHREPPPIPLKTSAVPVVLPAAPVSPVTPVPASPPALVPVPVRLLPPVRNVPPEAVQSSENPSQPRRSSVPQVQPSAVEPEKSVEVERSTEPELRHSAASDPQHAALAPRNAASTTVRQDRTPPAPEDRSAPVQNAAPAQNGNLPQASDKAQGAGQAQSAVQAALPVGAETYDPEAEARLKKSEWSQSDAGTAP